MKRIVGVLLVVLCAVALWGQEEKKPEAPMPPSSAYRVDVLLVELDGGKKINTRQFTLMTTDRGESVRLSTDLRLPYTGEKGPQYLDVGFEFSCSVRLLRVSGTYFETNGNLSSLAPESGSQSTPPPLRRNFFQGSTLVVSGKPFVLAGIDQLESNHRYELQVTVTKLNE